MSWTTPRDWTTGEVVTAAYMNAHVRDNLRYLKGLDGAATFEDDLTVDNLITAGNVDGVDVSAHDANTTTAHGAVSAATASKHVVRDGSARAKFAAPGAAGDALIKGTALTLTEMAPLTTDKWWKGVAGRPSEVDPPGTITYDQYTSSDTWTKPAGANWVYVEVISAGGGGGGAEGKAAGIDRCGGGAGGGGARICKLIKASDCGATESVTVGTGGTSGAGGSAATGSAGGDGGNSSFGTLVVSTGGKLGAGGAGDAVNGGSGGSNRGLSVSLSGNVGGGIGAKYVSSGIGYSSEYGGGAGGAGETTTGNAGGLSSFGGGGGGGGGGLETDNVEKTGGAGSASGATAGGAAGAVNGGAGGAGGAASGIDIGSGGGGGGAQDSGTGGVGGVGGAPGGGAGGGGGGTTVGGAGGVGGRGEVRVYSW